MLCTDNGIHNGAMELDTAAGTNLTAEAVGYTTVKAKVIRLEELPADAVVVILNVNPLKEGSNFRSY